MVNPRQSRLMIGAASAAVLVWAFLRRRTTLLRSIPEFVEERIVLPMGDLVREARANLQAEPATATDRMTRKVGRNRKISVGGKLYGQLDQALVGEQVEVELRDGRLVVWSGQDEVGSFEQQV